MTAELGPLYRPVTLGEMATGFGVSVTFLKLLVRRHEIDPACVIGRTRVYGPTQVKRVLDALCAEAEACTPGVSDEPSVLDGSRR